MTSLAFILGVIPLGTVVFFGMIAVTLFGVLFAPFFHVPVRRGAKDQ
jgi:multidrug efflux pump subunit AcrB